MKAKTSTRKMVETLLHPSFKGNESTQHGKRMEYEVRKRISEEFKKPVQLCGLVVSRDYPFLAASPGD